MAHPIISFGSSGPEVKVAQEALTKRGYLLGTIDGLFGPLTYRGLRCDGRRPRRRPRLAARLYTFHVPRTWTACGAEHMGQAGPSEIKERLDFDV